MNMRKLGALLTLIYLSSVSSVAFAVSSCKQIDFEQRKQISIQDFGRLANHETVSGDHGSIVIYYFDDEDRPHKKDSYAIGIAFARMGDLGETPVGGYIWAPNTVERVQFAKAASNDGDLVAQVTPNSRASCVAKPLDMTLKGDGRFLINGKLIDTVR